MSLSAVSVAKESVENMNSLGLTSAQRTARNVDLTEDIRACYWDAIKDAGYNRLKGEERKQVLAKLQYDFFTSIVPEKDIPEKGLTLTNAKGANPKESKLRNKSGQIRYAGWVKTKLSWRACSQLNIEMQQLSPDEIAPNGKLITRAKIQELIRAKK